MRAAGILWVPTQGTFCIRPRVITLIKSTQIRWFSRWSGRGGWSSRVVAQQRPRVSKLGQKGLSDYHSNEIAATAARWGGGQRAKLQDYSHREIYLRGELDNRSKPNRTRTKRSPPEKHFTAKRKSYSLFLGVMLKKGLLMTMLMSECQ
jgi:hypothetical protein